MSDFPDDMPEEMEAQLIADRFVFGNCFYEETENGYNRLDPAKVIDDE